MKRTLLLFLAVVTAAALAVAMGGWKWSGHHRALGDDPPIATTGWTWDGWTWNAPTPTL